MHLYIFITFNIQIHILLLFNWKYLKTLNVPILEWQIVLTLISLKFSPYFPERIQTNFKKQGDTEKAYLYFVQIYANKKYFKQFPLPLIHLYRRPFSSPDQSHQILINDGLAFS